MQKFFKLFTLLLSLTASLSLHAELKEQDNLYFNIRAEELMKGEIHYFFSLAVPKKLLKAHPILGELDSLKLFKEPQTRIVLLKSAYVINKPVGFFDQEHVSSEKYLSHVMGEQRVKKSEKGFIISVSGEAAHHYYMQTFFDSDDITTLPNSRVSKAILASKKLDVIAKSASGVLFKEMTLFSKYIAGAVNIASYIPLKENKTLVITYHLAAVKKKFADEHTLKSGFLEEISETKTLVESYRD